MLHEQLHARIVEWAWLALPQGTELRVLAQRVGRRAEAGDRCEVGIRCSHRITTSPHAAACASASAIDALGFTVAKYMRMRARVSSADISHAAAM